MKFNLDLGIYLINNYVYFPSIRNMCVHVHLYVCVCVCMHACLHLSVCILTERISK